MNAGDLKPPRYKPIRGADITVSAEAEEWLLALAFASDEVERSLKKLRAFQVKICEAVAAPFDGKRFTTTAERNQAERDIAAEIAKRYRTIHRSELIHLAADYVAASRYRARILEKLDAFDFGEGLGHMPEARCADAAIDFDGRRTVTVRVGAAVREIKFPMVMEAGVYRAGHVYEGGDMVTYANATWVAQRDTAVSPGTPDSGWRLLVKSPRREGR